MVRFNSSNVRVNHGGGHVEIGVVGTRGAVRFVAVARTRAMLYVRIAEYVSTMVETQLYPENAEQVRELLASNSAAAAVEAYFAAVGARWDEEWLEVRTVALEDGVRGTALAALESEVNLAGEAPGEAFRRGR